MRRNLPQMLRGGRVAAVDLGSAKFAGINASFDADILFHPREDRERDIFSTLTARSKELVRAAGVQKGHVIRPAEAAIALKALKSQMEKGGEKLRRVCLTASGGRPRYVVQQGEIVLTALPVNKDDIRRALAVTMPEDVAPFRTILHSFNLGFSIDGGPWMADPRGLEGQSLQVRRGYFIVDSVFVSNLLEVAGLAGLEVIDIAHTALASALAVMRDSEGFSGVRVIDMGAQISTMTHFSGGAMQSFVSLGAGGLNVTRDVAMALTISEAEAERLKIRNGAAVGLSGDDNEKIRLSDGQELTGFPRSALVGVVRPRLQETLSLLRDRADDSGNDPLVLCGGAAQMPALPELVQSVFDAQARFGRPVKVSSLGDSKTSAFLTGAAGALVQVLEKSQDGWDEVLTEPPVLPPGRRRFLDWWKKNW